MSRKDNYIRKDEVTKPIPDWLYVGCLVLLVCLVILALHYANVIEVTDVNPIGR